MSKSFDVMRGERGVKSEVVTNELGHLWAKLLQRGALETYRSIGFCAIGDDEGSNAVCARLGLFLGSRGKNVTLVEASLRAPELSEMFEVTSSPGLADLLGKLNERCRKLGFQVRFLFLRLFQRSRNKSHQFACAYDRSCGFSFGDFARLHPAIEAHEDAIRCIYTEHLCDFVVGQAVPPCRAFP